MSNVLAQCMVLKPGIWNSIKKLKNISLSYQEAIKHICGRSSYDTDSKLECHVQENLPISKHFLVKKHIQITFRLYFSQCQCLSKHQYCFRCESLFCKFTPKLFRFSYSDFNQIIDVFDNPSNVCSNMADWLCSVE